MVAEEYQIEVLGSTYEPPRPQPVRGTVHDENAWALGGVSGHAGVFSTVILSLEHDTLRPRLTVTGQAYDLAIFLSDGPEQRHVS